MNNHLRRMLVIPIVFSFGCAAIFHGSSQEVHIRSNVPDADLYVNEGYVGKGSGVASFKKNSSYTITARKEGCTAASVPASKSFDAVTLLGILIDFGIISILIIDGAATGAWSQFDQTNFVIDPACTRAAAQVNAVSAP
jgi:hypothetical protein